MYLCPWNFLGLSLSSRVLKSQGHFEESSVLLPYKMSGSLSDWPICFSCQRTPSKLMEEHSHIDRQISVQMPRQRLISSDTDPQCTNDTLHQSGRYGMDSESDLHSHRHLGLTKSYGSSRESTDSHLPTNSTSDSEVATEESFAGGAGRTDVRYEPSILFAYLLITSVSLNANETGLSTAIYRA